MKVEAQLAPGTGSDPESTFRLLERALQVQAELDPDDALTRCDLLLALGEALLPTDEALRVNDRVAADAFALAEANQDHPRAVRAAMQALDAMYRASDIGGSQFGQWVIRADAHAALGTAERVYADCYLALKPSRAPRSWATTLYPSSRAGSA